MVTNKRQVRKIKERFGTHLPEAGNDIRQAPELWGQKTEKQLRSACRHASQNQKSHFFAKALTSFRHKNLS
jgi:hypothetical protein